MVDVGKPPSSWFTQKKILSRGREDYDRLRPLSYPNANLVLICYDWYPEVNHFCHGVPIILVGCKTDLRKDKTLARKLWSSGQNPITYIQGEETKRKNKAELYLECSAKYKENVEDIFREATKQALAATRKSRKAKRNGFCALL
uniref:rho-related GTP-binding protein RhoF-like isoform X2 n=1 Tax=Oncorhynchus gorbuscha TaxID=8017 RepID=UPI001EAEDE3E|nr:rho-related GTP-binding protein RhoF-like isoform X2 [Oncorhynchus gorbuscha]